MLFQEMINKMLQDNSNIVNSMYTHELNIKWSNFQKLTTSTEKIENNEIIKTLNEFNKAVSNKKYRYNPYDNKGFKDNSPIFSAKYFDEAIDILIKRQPILKNKGIVWGYHKFNTNIQFSPKNLIDMENLSILKYDESPELLQLCQIIELQYRIFERRNFHRYRILLPLIIFHTMKNVTAKSLLEIEHIAKNAKKTFSKAKTIVVAETIDRDIKLLENSRIDAIFILQKRFQNTGFAELQLDVFNTLENRISKFLNEKRNGLEMFLKRGFIE